MPNNMAAMKYPNVEKKLSGVLRKHF